MAADDPLSLTFKYSGQAHVLTLAAGECPYARVSAIIGVPATRLKIIRSGKVLPPPGAPTLRTSLVNNGVYLVTGSADQLPSTSRRWANEVRERALKLYADITYAQLRDVIYYLCGSVLSLARASVSFVTSMVIPPAPANEGTRRGDAN